MNRFTAILVQGSARLAFWRKPAATPADVPETSAPEAATNSRPLDPLPDAAIDAPTPGRFARLKQALRWRRSPPEEASPAPDLAAASEPPLRERVDANAGTEDGVPAPKLSLLARLRDRLRRRPELPADTAAPADAAALADQALNEPPSRERADADAEDDVPAPKRSLLARLKNRLRRQPDTPPEAVADSDAPTPGSERRRRDESADEDSDDDEDAEPVSRVRRALALLSNKWVWIPGVSAVLLALVGAMTLMLLQSAQEKQHLQAELLATQKKLQQTITKKAAAKHGSPGQAGDSAGATVADSSPGVNDGDCTVTNKESVILNLKNCIDSFNSSQ